METPKVVDATNRTPFRHDYLVAGGKTYSFGPSNGGLYETGTENPNRASCQLICDDDNFDQYVDMAARFVWHSPYFVGAFEDSISYDVGYRNCQTWVDEVIKYAIEFYLKYEPCPKCFK